MVTLQDTHKLIEKFNASREDVSRVLADGLNELLKQSSFPEKEWYVLSPYMASDIDKIAFKSPYSQFLELKYPIDILSSTIHFIYKNNGVLLLSDIEAYMRNSRFKNRLPVLG